VPRTPQARGQVPRARESRCPVAPPDSRRSPTAARGSARERRCPVASPGAPSARVQVRGRESRCPVGGADPSAPTLTMHGHADLGPHAARIRAGAAGVASRRSPQRWPPLTIEDRVRSSVFDGGQSDPDSATGARTNEPQLTLQALGNCSARSDGTDSAGGRSMPIPVGRTLLRLSPRAPHCSGVGGGSHHIRTIAARSARRLAPRVSPSRSASPATTRRRGSRCGQTRPRPSWAPE